MSNHAAEKTKNNKKSIRYLRRSFSILIILSLIAALSAIFYISFLTRKWDSFNPENLPGLNKTSFVYDREGRIISELHGIEDRLEISIDEIPAHVLNAFIAVEDVRFLTHKGFDIKRIFGALIADIKAGSLVEGASTITQQLVKNTLLTNEKTIDRKLQEVYLAWQMEKHYSKEEILEMYLNVIYFGDGQYGIETASNHYFGKSINQLDVPEGAMLAAIPKSPNNYSPTRNPVKALKRRNLILNLMAENEFLTPSEADFAVKSPLKITNSPKSIFEHGYYTDIAIDKSVDLLLLDDEKDLLTSGYNIYTTLDGSLQQFLEILYSQDELFPKSPQSGELCESAAVILDVKSGQVLALMGGREYTARKVLNRAVYVKRQPGSAVKPLLVYGPAVEYLNYYPAKGVIDEPYSIGEYTVSNYSDNYKGLISTRTALAKSVNIPAVKIFKEMGPRTGIEFVKGLGIDMDEEDDNNLALALGGFSKGITPLEMAGAYQSFANKGTHIKPYFIEKIDNSQDKNVYTAEINESKVMRKQTAFLITSMLQSTAQWGTAKKLGELGTGICAKTGTTQLPDEIRELNGNKDAWIAVYTADYVIIIWMGFDQTDTNSYLPSGTVGGGEPAQIAKLILKELYKNKTIPSFVMPDGIETVNIDLKVFNETGEVNMASDLTPKKYLLKEYFPSELLPLPVSPYWQIPNPPSDFNLVLDSDDRPLILFTTHDSQTGFYLSRLYENEIINIHNFSPNITGSLSYTDLLAEKSGVYSYFITPYSSEITDENGNHLKGQPTITLSVEIIEPSPTPILPEIPPSLLPELPDWLPLPTAPIEEEPTESPIDDEITEPTPSPDDDNQTDDESVE